MSEKVVERLQQSATLTTGDPAPDFTLPGVITKPEEKRVSVTLSEYRGKSVLLVFYVAAFTGG